MEWHMNMGKRQPSSEEKQEEIQQVFISKIYTKVYLNGKRKGRHDNLYLANNRMKNWIFYEKFFVLERND